MLKPSGSCLIVDIEARDKDHFREVFYAQAVPDHSRSGIDMGALIPSLEENGLLVSEQSVERGLIILTVQPSPSD